MIKWLLVFIVLVPFSLALPAPIHPGIPGSKIVYVGSAKEVVKSPFQHPVLKITQDGRRSRYRPETYIMGGQIGVFERPTGMLQHKAPEYMSYGIPKAAPMETAQGRFLHNKYVYGIDTQVIKRFVPFRRSTS